MKLILLVVAMAYNIFASDFSLDISSFENSIKSKRRIEFVFGLHSSIGERLVYSDIVSPKLGYSLGLGVELLRDKFFWQFYIMYIPKSYFTQLASTSVTDIGIEFKGLMSYSRYISFTGLIGMLSRAEISKYFSYSLGTGIEISPVADFSISPCIIFKSAFKKFNLTQSVYNKSFEFVMRTMFNF